MHNLYFDCQICHVRPKEGKKRIYYYWYNRSNGEIVFNPEIGDSPIDFLNIKLSPCNTCDSKPGQEDIENERALVGGFISRLKKEQLSSVEKEEIVEQIHENISEQRVYCKECHNKKDSFLPLEEIGYTKQRISMVASDQITKMINEYKEFHNPSFMEPARRTGR
jgi:hypothetical protein